MLLGMCESKSRIILFIITYHGRCGHCKRLAPTWDELANRVGDPVVIAKVLTYQRALIMHVFVIGT